MYALLLIFLGLFGDLSNPREQLLLQSDMITSSGVKHFPSQKMDIARRNFAYLCKVPVSINFAMDFIYYPNTAYARNNSLIVVFWRDFANVCVPWCCQ